MRASLTAEFSHSCVDAIELAERGRPRKAFSRGSCQACGQVHKLPRDVIAKHGHHVFGSAFHGTCMGSDEAPFEETCALVLISVDQACAELQNLKLKADLLLEPATVPTAWIHEYHPHAKEDHEGGGFRWFETMVAQQAALRLRYAASSGLDAPYPFMLEFSDLLDACTKLNGKYRERVVLREIARTERYILWQGRRAASWAPAALLPRDPDNAPEQVAFFDLELLAERKLA